MIAADTSRDRKSAINPRVDFIEPAAVDWDLILQMNNSWFDRIVESAGEPRRSKRQKAMADIYKETEDLCKAASDFKSFTWSLLSGPRRVVSEQLG